MEEEVGRIFACFDETEAPCLNQRSYGSATSGNACWDHLGFQRLLVSRSFGDLLGRLRNLLGDSLLGSNCFLYNKSCWWCHSVLPLFSCQSQAHRHCSSITLPVTSDRLCSWRDRQVC